MKPVVAGQQDAESQFGPFTPVFPLVLSTGQAVSGFGISLNAQELRILPMRTP